MKNPNIARMLKYYRKLNQLSVNDVASVFKKHNNEVAVKTIYGWESGQTQPSADNLMFLCELYHIDNILETFGYQSGSDEPLVLTDFEKKLIISYRKNTALHPAIHRLLELDNGQLLN